MTASFAGETVVASGETLELNVPSVTNAVETVVRAMGGSTLTISPANDLPADGSWGFAAYHGTTLPADADWPAAGTSEAAALALFKYDGVASGYGRAERVHLYETGVTDRQFDIYAATWRVTEAVTVSLFEHFASKVLVILDGTVILSDKYWNGESTVKDISIAAGDHALVIVLATEGQNKCTPKTSYTSWNSDGRYGHANDGKVPGLVYNTANADLTLSSLGKGADGVAGTVFFQNASEDDRTFTTYAPSALRPSADETVPRPAMNLNLRILVDGGADGAPVRLDLTKAHLPETGICVSGGILATNAGSLVVVGTDRLRVGGYTLLERHWTPFGVPLTFENADGSPNPNGTVAFERCVTLFSLPAVKTFEDGMSLALRGPNVLDDETLAQSATDLQLQAGGVRTEGETIGVTNRTVALKPCVSDPSYLWNWYGVSGAFTNDFALGGESAVLLLSTLNPVTVRGRVTGTGVIEADVGQSDFSKAVTTFDGPVTMTGTIRTKGGTIVFNQATPGDASNPVVIDENPYAGGSTWNREIYGAVRLNPEGAGTVATTASISRVEAYGRSYLKYGKTPATPMNGRILVPRLQTLRIGTFDGCGCVWGDDRDSAPADCSAEIGALETNSYLRVILRRRCSIGRMGARSTARLLPELDAFEVDDLGGGARVLVQGTTAVRIGAGAQGTLVISSTTGTVPLTLGADGDATDGTLGALLFESRATVTVTNGAIQAVSGAGTLVIAGRVRLGTVAPETVVRVLEGGNVTWAEHAVPGALSLGADIDPAVWFDADAGASTYRQLSLAGHPNVVYTNDSVVIDQWYDVRPWQRDYYGWNRRCEGLTETHQQVYPYLLTNSCGGRTTLQFDTYGNWAHGIWSSSFKADGTDSRAGRRLPFNVPITARWAIMVFGSENGGGTAVLGGYTNWENGRKYSTPAPLQRFADEYYTEAALDAMRPGAMYALARDWTQPIFHEKRPTWVDGEAVDPTVTGFNGGYQILSFEITDSTGANGMPVQSLGACGKHGNDAAGQIYGEVLIFTNALTTVQRQRVEQYLSRKWGIPLKGAPAPSASVEVLGGGAVTVEGDPHGSVAFPGSASLAIGGDFRAAGVQTGTVTLDGGTLEIPSLSLPPDEGEIPTANLRAWYDPDDATRYLKRTIANDTRPLAVDALFSKFSGTTKETYDDVAYLSGFLGQTDYLTADQNNKADRRPWKSAGARGTGPERTWLDYTVFPANDASGNCLRPKMAFSDWSAINSTPRVAQSFRTAFIVTDTSKGGGNVICDTSGMAPTKARSGYKVTDPIWPSGSLAAFTNGVTRLDGEVVDACRTGYTGRPELLTVETDGTAAQFCALGYYNGWGANGETKERSQEILGEMIFYTTVLDDAARAGVEAYLMKKWLGKLPQGYVDWRGATVTGSGTVLAPSAAHLPAFDGTFSGTVVLTNAVLTFALDDTGAVTNAISLPSGVTAVLPSEGTVSVVASGRMGEATLIDAGALEMGELVRHAPAGWTLHLAPADRDLRLRVENGKLMLARPRGLRVLVR